VLSTHMGLADPWAYILLAAIVRQQINDGTLPPGRPAPSITRLSQEHGHARPTCGKALRMLEDEGLLTRIPGLGYYVKCFDIEAYSATLIS
jgi:DNA-binding GntR family transcriptional regulator